jgi:hypothetical protein
MGQAYIWPPELSIYILFGLNSVTWSHLTARWSWKHTLTGTTYSVRWQFYSVIFQFKKINIK